MRVLVKQTIWSECYLPEDSAKEIMDMMIQKKPREEIQNKIEEIWINLPDELLLDTREDISVIENGGCATYELFTDEIGENPLYDNAEEIYSEDTYSVGYKK